ncbi:MAG: KamA family radical SAM protein [Bacteroidales bacterium]
MATRDMLYMTCAGWIDIYRAELPELWEIIQQQDDAISFEKNLAAVLREKLELPFLNTVQKEALECLLQLIAQSEIPCLESSEEEMVECRTLRHLWTGLRENQELNHPDFYHEMYHLLREAFGKENPRNGSLVSEEMQMNRWPSGLDPEVVGIRDKNKQRIIAELIKDIPYADSEVRSGRYRFPQGCTDKEKIQFVNQWWDDHRFHLAMAIRNPEKLNRYLGFSLSPEIVDRLSRARDKGIPFFITPYYLSLLNPCDTGYDDKAIRDYVIYSDDLIANFGSIKAWEREDCIKPEQGNAAGWLLPDAHSVHRRYPEVAILIPDTMGRACGGLCASCQRMYGFQKGNLNFDLDSLKPQKGWMEKLDNCLTYFENDSQLRDILITGGDALMSQNKTLRVLLHEVLKMVVRKREFNLKREDGDKFAELQRIRLGSRLPAYLPFRINDELVEILKEFRAQGQRAGISQFIIQTHFQSPLEMTPEAAAGIKKLLNAGWIVTNQLVFTVPVSRRGHTARLRQVLNENGVICYYTFSVKGFDENKNLFVPNCRSVQEQQEEKSYGRMTAEVVKELMHDLTGPDRLRDTLKELLLKHNLPFLATDRSVMNLPGVGKSMSFRLVGLDHLGRRLLAFSHDKTRRHSPVITHFPEVVIRERKSVGAYLRQLEKMGEDLSYYESIWSYRRAETEPRFRFYEYPAQQHQVTNRITNLAE